MPGACWFRTREEALNGIDALVTAGGNAEHFWEIMQPFGYKVGQRETGVSAEYDSSISQGRWHARIVKGMVTEVYVSSSRPWDTAATPKRKPGTSDSIL